MKIKLVALFTFAMFGCIANAQINQRFDNSNYRAIYFKEACELIATSPNLVLLDVRSPGEFAENGKDITYRIGRLKNAINISIDSLQKNDAQLESYRNKPILVYCSHSQRSRVVSKALADAGFKNVYSLNGGMTEVDKASNLLFPCKSSLYTSTLPYKFMGPDDAYQFVRDKRNLVIDVRAAAAFNGKDTTASNNVGRIATAINIPLSKLDARLPTLEPNKNRPILVYDLYTQDAMHAAEELSKAGYKNVSVLFEGLNTFLTNASSGSVFRKSLVAGAPAYKIVGVKETVDLVNRTPGLIIADMRPQMEFKNMSGENYHNLGHIKHALNFTPESLSAYLKNKPKSTPILLYGSFGTAMKMRGMDNIDLSALSNQLLKKGFTNVYLLYNGIYSVVWASGNTNGLQSAKSILVDHQNLY